MSDDWVDIRVLVTGGRGYTDARTVNAALNQIHAKHGIGVIIQGEAAGADYLARMWAEAAGVPVWRVGKEDDQ